MGNEAQQCLGRRTRSTRRMRTRNKGCHSEIADTKKMYCCSTFSLRSRTMYPFSPAIALYGMAQEWCLMSMSVGEWHAIAYSSFLW